MGQDLFEHALALLERKEGLALLGVAQGGHHDLVEEAGGPLDYFEMSVVEGVEGSGEQTDLHELAFMSWPCMQLALHELGLHELVPVR